MGLLARLTGAPSKPKPLPNNATFGDHFLRNLNKSCVEVSPKHVYEEPWDCGGALQVVQSCSPYETHTCSPAE